MTLLGDAKSAVGGAFCSLFNNYDKANRFLAGLIYPDRIDEVYPRSPAGQVANSGIALFCDRSPLPKPFEIVGGQCNAFYEVRSGTNFDGTTGGQGPQTSFANEGNLFRGPFTGFRPEVGPAFRTTYYVTGPNLGPTTLIGYVIEESWINPRPFFMLTLLGGGPDNCGNPPPGPPLTPADRTTNININNTNGTVVFAFPTLNVNGDLQVPFTLNVGELNLNGTLELNTGDIAFNFGGQPTDPDAPIVPTPDGTVPPADQDDPENNKPANIIGVIVVSTPISDTTATVVPSTTTPDLYIPRLADVLFKIRIKSKSHWTSDIPVKTTNAYIHCPGEIDAIDVKVIQRKGWSSSITPVRGIVPSNQVELL